MARFSFVLVALALAFACALAAPEKVYRRVVVVGDLHGDLKQALRVLLATDLITLQPNYYQELEEEASNHEGHNHDQMNKNMVYNKRAGIMLGSDADMYHWCAGNTLLVMTGDAMNVGPDDLAIVRLVMRLHVEAAAAGGHLEFTFGNHEMRNLQGDFDGVHPWSFEQSGGEHGRKFLLSMETDMGAFLRTRKSVFRYHHWIFMHGGMMPTTIKAIKSIEGKFDPETFVDVLNEAVTAKLTGNKHITKEQEKLAKIVTDVDYDSNGEVSPLLIHPLEMCDGVAETMKLFNGVITAQIVGHTPHDLPKFVFCEGQLFAIDFGLSRWKTGVGAAVSGLILMPHREMAQERNEDVPSYTNEKTLGKGWSANLVIATEEDFPQFLSGTFAKYKTDVKLYMIGCIVLLVIIALLLVIIWHLQSHTMARSAAAANGDAEAQQMVSKDRKKPDYGSTTRT